MNRMEIFEKVYGKCEWHESALLHLMRVVDLVQESIEQSITDPENQPSQYGTVTLEMYESVCKQRNESNRTIERLRDELQGCRALAHKYISIVERHQTLIGALEDGDETS